MWRYLVGGIAALLLVGAGLMLFRGTAREPVLPAAPAGFATAGEPQGDDDLPAAAPAASDRTREQKRFDRYDKDKDGRVTREEYLTARRKAFAKLDVNGDGRLSFDEWAVKATTKFATADTDRSGAMDRKEFATTAVPRKAPRAQPKCLCPPTVKSGDED